MAEIEKSDYDAVNDFCKMIGDVQGMLLRVIREKEALERENKELNERIKDLTDKLRAAKKREEAAAKTEGGADREAIRNAIREVQERNVFLAGKYKELEQSLARYEEAEEE